MASKSYAPFDDDEESPPIGFEQDEDEDELGVGTWHYADGSSRYSKGDADDAKALMKKDTPAAADLAADVARESDAIASAPRELSTRDRYDNAARRLAEGPGAQQKTALPGLQQPDPMRGAVAGPGGGEEPSDELEGSPRRLIPAEAPEKPKPLDPLRAPGLPGARGPARYSDSAQAQRSQSQNTSTSDSESTQRSAMSQADFDAQQKQTAEGYQGAMQSAVGGASQEAGAIRQRAEQLAQMGRDKEAAASGAIAQRDERANYVKTKIQEVGSRKTDMNGLWKEKGPLGTTLGLLGVALRSLNATKFGGPNTALQSIEKQREQNLRGQMEDRDSELRGLEKELGSLDAAVPMLEARMRDAEAKRLESMMADEKSQAVLANGNKLVSQLRLERDAKLAESAKAFAGTVAKQQASSQGSTLSTGETTGRERVSGAGIGDQGGQKRMTPREIAEADQAWEEQGVPQEERARLWTANGYAAPSGKTAAEYKREHEGDDAEGKRSEAEGKAQAASDALGNFYGKAGLIRDPQSGKWKPSDEGIVPPGFVESVNPFDDDDIAASGNAAAEAYGRLQSGGVIGDDERVTFRDLVGLNTGNRQQLAARANAIEATLKARQPGDERKKGTKAPDAWKKKPGASP